ncbi:MAG: hypothetical protein AAFP82_16805 [Bacteroidota bacterium]
MKNLGVLSEIDLARKSIMTGETSKTFSILFDCISHLEGEEIRKIHNELCIHSHNFNQLEKNRRLGTISNEALIQNSNQLSVALIETISNLENCVEAQGMTVYQIDTNNSFRIPRATISTKLYNAFLIIGVCLGIAAGGIFLLLYYAYLMKEQQQLSELLYIVSIALLSSLFLFGSFDGLNRQKRELVDLKIIAPHLLLIIILLVISGVLSL